MIRVETVSIREIRGIRELDLDLGRASYAVMGPNGSGKSGVVDAIEFALTGDISRLVGRGSGGLSLSIHGPHVTKRNDPAAAIVQLRVCEPVSGKSATLTRCLKSPKKFTIDPDHKEVRRALEEVAQHPELTLSRREVIKYVVATPGDRAREIQALLRLDNVEAARLRLRAAQTQLATAKKTAERDSTGAEESLGRLLDLRDLNENDVLAILNRNRALLGLDELAELTPSTKLDTGVVSSPSTAFDKDAAKKDIEALLTSMDQLEEDIAEPTAEILVGISELKKDPGLLATIMNRDFYQRGLDLVLSTRCPLCGIKWTDMEALREHIRHELERTERAEKIGERMRQAAARISDKVQALDSKGRSVKAAASAVKDEKAGPELDRWLQELKEVALSLESPESAVRAEQALQRKWPSPSSGVTDRLAGLLKMVAAQHDKSSVATAQTFLAIAQERYSLYQSKRREAKEATEAANLGQAVYQAYCTSSEAALEKLYQDVESDFAGYYRRINSSDESDFKAEFEYEEGSLDLKVRFYDQGMFPPAAYHSEGHQDGMGVCLYLALMRRLLGDHFTFCVLDDVVMSVDRDHRKQFCRLLASEFADTQFVITTHDAVWAKQMVTEGLVPRRSSITFQAWSVETGPIHELDASVWERIASDLGRNDVPEAAAKLRRYMEYFFAELADQLAAPTPFRGDGSYDQGDLCSAAIGKHGRLLKEAVRVARSWSNDKEERRVQQLIDERAATLEEHGGESWVLNKAIHYNEWADFSRADFEPVVKAFKAVTGLFECSNAECHSSLYVVPARGTPEEVRCACSTYRLNLKQKP